VFSLWLFFSLAMFSGFFSVFFSHPLTLFVFFSLMFILVPPLSIFVPPLGSLFLGSISGFLCVEC
jgi:hypothetical protein